MNLAIDIGNTYTKIGIFKNDELVFNAQYAKLDKNILQNLLDKYSVGMVIISSVKKNGNEDWQGGNLAQQTQLYYFNTKMAANIKNHYLTPQTLGLDRLAAVVGARYLYPAKNNLVISGGTCITYDLVDSEGNYFGGSISPGLNMRYMALNNYTGNLPLINAEDDFIAYYGNDTISAMRSGVQNGIKYELTGFIENYKIDSSYLNIVLCGGDGIFFDSLLKNSIFARYIKNEPYLVLKGLNAALYDNND